MARELYLGVHNVMGGTQTEKIQNIYIRNFQNDPITLHMKRCTDNLWPYFRSESLHKL